MRSFHSLNQWLNALNNQNVSSLTPEEVFAQVCEMVLLLGLNKPIASYVIAITGTNGKGSVATCLEKLFCQSGKQVGCITSPHLIHFNERIRLNGIPVDDARICHAYNLIESVREHRELGFAQFAYLAGLMILAEENLDVAILEIGLGGRLDVMNAVENDMTIITNVDYDHCEQLGCTLEAIGFEKAALIRKNTPVVIGDLLPPQTVLDKVREQQAEVFCAQKDFFYEESEKEWNGFFCGKEYNHLPKPTILIQNAATALQAFFIYAKKNNLSLSEAWLSSALRDFEVPGRQEKFRKRCDWLLDVAHNPQAVKALAQVIKQGKQYKKIYALCGMCADKDIINSIKPMTSIVDEWMLCALPSPRSAKQEALKTIFKLLNCENFDYDDSIQTALNKLYIKIEPDDLVVVFGSFMLVGEVKSG